MVKMPWNIQAEVSTLIVKRKIVPIIKTASVLQEKSELQAPMQVGVEIQNAPVLNIVISEYTYNPERKLSGLFFCTCFFAKNSLEYC